MNLSGIVDLAGSAATGILFLLLGLSVVQLAILVERAVTFVQTRLPGRRMRELRLAIEQGLWDAIETVGVTSLPERVLAAGLRRAGDGADAADEVMRAQLAERKLGLERRLSFLATLGNNAPFIGLLGTVLGIMHAFANLSMAGGQVSAEVMSGISEALVSTGVGLMVALPAVIAFNWFQRVIKARVVAAETLSGALLAQLKARREPAGGRLVVMEAA